jgi:hypothetical protein
VYTPEFIVLKGVPPAIALPLRTRVGDAHAPLLATVRARRGRE